MNILAIGAHPDDIEFGCGHVLIQETRKGNRVRELVLSKGEASSNGTPESREAETRAAAKLIGADLEFLHFGGDCHMECTPKHAFEIAAEIRKFRPEIVLAPHVDENQHPDHSVVGKIARDACRFARYAGLEELKGFTIKGYEPYSIAALYFYGITKEFGTPDVVVDIGDVVQDWEAAMKCHQSQLRTRSYADLRLTGARNLGLSIGVEYAAGFYVSDPVRVGALSDITLSSRHF